MSGENRRSPTQPSWWTKLDDLAKLLRKIAEICEEHIDHDAICGEIYNSIKEPFTEILKKYADTLLITHLMEEED